MHKNNLVSYQGHIIKLSKNKSYHFRMTVVSAGRKVENKTKQKL